MQPLNSTVRPPARLDVVAYVLAANAPAAAGLVSGVITRRLLGPEAFGIYFFAAALAAYFVILHSPLNSVIDVEIPLMEGQVERSRIDGVLGGVYGILAIASMGEAALVGVLGFAWSGGHTITLPLIAAVMIALPLDAISQIDRLLLKSVGGFGPLLKVSTATAVVEGLVDVGLTVAFGLEGFAVAVVLGAALRAGAHRKAAQRLIPIRPIVRRAWHEAGGTIRRSSGALFVYKVSQFGMENVDRLIVGSIMGPVAVGVYSLGVAAVSVAKLLPRSVAGAVLPAYLRARADDRSDGAAKATESLHTTVVWLTVALGSAMVVAIEFGVPALLPEFAEVMRPAQILVVAEVAQQARFAQSSQVLGSASRRPLVVSAIGGLVAAVVGGTLAARADTLTYVAVASLVAYSVSFVCLTLSSAQVMPWRRITRTMLAVLHVGAVVLGAAWLPPPHFLVASVLVSIAATAYFVGSLRSLRLTGVIR